jgi:hypothetical protein
MPYGLKRFQKAEALRFITFRAGGPLINPESNPVKRGLVASAGDYQWSGFNHYATGVRGAVEIESEWTASLRGPLIAIGPR